MNAQADSAAGFRWRLQTDEGNATGSCLMNAVLSETRLVACHVVHVVWMHGSAMWPDGEDRRLRHRGCCSRDMIHQTRPGIAAFEWDVEGTSGVIVNLSTWASIEDLRTYIYSGQHVAVLRRRREWFHRVAEATTALWWVPAGHRPTTAEAEDRLRHLRKHGPTREAFTMQETFPA